MVVGIADHGIFLSSDIPSFLEWTKKVAYLHDYDIVMVDKSGVKIYNLIEGEVSRPVDTVDCDAEQIKKGEFELTDPIMMLNSVIEVRVVQLNGYWNDIGYPWDYLDVSMYVLNKIGFSVG